MGGCRWRLRLTCSDGDGADDDAVLQHHAQHQEDKVEQEHGEAQRLVHLPPARPDGDDDEEEHDEEQHDGTEEPVAADRNWGQVVDGGVQEPRDREAVNVK